MHAWTRPNEPEELRKARPALTREFVLEKRRTDLTPDCKWPNVRREDGEMETLHDFLSRSTNGHCNYCDSLLGYAAPETIDHFLPKSNPKFACLAYVWRNLYLCCRDCQHKGTRHDKRALRPDEKDAQGNHYQFSRYFRYCRDGTIKVIATDDLDLERAALTLEVLDLNDPELVSKRSGVFNAGLKPRMRPLRNGLDGQTALARDKVLKWNPSSQPYRDFFDQSADD